MWPEEVRSVIPRVQQGDYQVTLLDASGAAAHKRAHNYYWTFIGCLHAVF